LQLKFSVYDLLPLRLLGLGDPNESEARRCIIACLAIWATVKNKALEHYLAWLLLDASSPLFTEVTLFVAGARLASLPAFSCICTQFVVATFERKNAFAMTEIRPDVSCVCVSGKVGLHRTCRVSFQ